MEVKKRLNAETHAYAAELLDRYGLGAFKDYYPRPAFGRNEAESRTYTHACFFAGAAAAGRTFSALDYQQRLLLADEVHSIIKRGGYTAVLVTHDISEAICMSDRVIILSERPARIRKQVEINMGSDTPLERRSNPLFREYYDAVWSEFRLAGERQQLMRRKMRIRRKEFEP